jgi:hypothetical protein
VAYLKLPKLYHHDFRNLQTAPNGAVEVDRSNPLSRDLLDVLIPGQGLRSIELGLEPTTYVPADWSFYSHPIYGRTLRGSNTSSIVYQDVDRNQTGSWSAFAIMGGTNDFSVTPLNYALTDNHRNVLVRPVNDTAGGYNNLNPLLPSTNIETGELYKITVVWDSVNNVFSAYRDGVLIGSETSSVQISTKNFGYDLDLRLILNFSSYWDRALDPSEVKEVNTNHKQLLKPKKPITYFLPTQVEVLNPIPLPKKYHPDFKHPLVSPSGAVQVDWSNPITKDLQFLNIQGSDRNLVTAHQARDFALPTSGKQGMGIKTVLSGAEQVEFPTDPKTVFDGDYTMVSFMDRFGEEGSLPGFLAHRTGTASDGVCQLVAVSGELRTYAYDGSLQFVGFSNLPDVTTLPNPLFVAAASNSVDSVGIAGSPGNTAPELEVVSGGLEVGTAGQQEMVIGGLAASQTTHHQFGNYYLSAAFNRSLSEEELKSLYHNPFQLVKPLIPTMYFVAEGDGDTSETINFFTEALSLDEKSFNINETVDFNTQNLNIADQSFSIDTAISFNTETLNLAGQSFNIDVSVDFGAEELNLESQVFSIQEGGETVSMSTADITLNGQGFDVNEEVDFNTETINVAGETFSIEEGSVVFFNTEAITVTGNSFNVDESVDMNEETINVTGNTFSLGDVIEFNTETLNKEGQTFSIEEGDAVFMGEGTLEVTGLPFTLQVNSVCFMNTEELILSGRAQELKGWWEFFLALPNLDTISLNDRVREYTESQGAEGISFNDRFYNWLGDKGYEGAFNDRLDQWQEDGFPP